MLPRTGTMWACTSLYKKSMSNFLNLNSANSIITDSINYRYKLQLLFELTKMPQVILQMSELWRNLHYCAIKIARYLTACQKLCHRIEFSFL